MMAMNLVNFAQYERELISERTKAALAAKKRRGERIGRPRVATASVVRRIVQDAERRLDLRRYRFRAHGRESPKPTRQTDVAAVHGAAHLRQRHGCNRDGGVGVMAATIRKRDHRQAGQVRQSRSSATKCGGANPYGMSSARQPARSSRPPRRFDTRRRPRRICARLRISWTGARGVDPLKPEGKGQSGRWGTYAKQYLESLAGTIDESTIQGYEKIYRTHIAPVFGSKPVASITTADVASFRAQLLAPHERRSFVTRGKPDPKRKPKANRTVHRSPATVKQIVGTLKRILDTAEDDQAIQGNPVVSGRRRHSTKRRVTGETPFAHHPLTANQVASVCDWIAQHQGQRGLRASRSCSRRIPVCGRLSYRACRCKM